MIFCFSYRSYNIQLNDIAYNCSTVYEIYTYILVQIVTVPYTHDLRPQRASILIDVCLISIFIIIYLLIYIYATVLRA